MSEYKPSSEESFKYEPLYTSYESSIPFTKILAIFESEVARIKENRRRENGTKIIGIAIGAVIGWIIGEFIFK